MLTLVTVFKFDCDKESAESDKENTPISNATFKSPKFNNRTTKFFKNLIKTPKRIHAKLKSKFGGNSDNQDPPDMSQNVNDQNAQHSKTLSYVMPCNRKRIEQSMSLQNLSEDMKKKVKSSRNVTVPQSPFLRTKILHALTPKTKRSISGNFISDIIDKT